MVIMHGKGGSPDRYVSDLASSLEARSYRVINLEMPWSGRREYDVSVDAAAKEVQSALDALRSRGAKRLFITGHSLGALFALYYAGKQSVDGVIAIAPGGSVSTPIYREKLGESVDLARRLIAEGKANEKTRFTDYEGARGTYTVVTTPAVYLSWFNPDGAMSLIKAVKSMNTTTPVLYVAPKGDYPILLKAKQVIFGALPPHAMTKLYEPDSDHLDAPSASRDEIFRWTSQIASRG
jgi:pimeloyl-ACP methyl ester carboxylesterase